jgi:hypothetical protein
MRKGILENHWETFDDIVDFVCLAGHVVLPILFHHTSNNLSPKEILNSDGQQFHQYQQNKQ